ncbi:MAG: DUF2461 domain-containing protein [Flavobacteriales bacterium]|nr:DUF2461 domain-containing protein [Flavobacteriales bacterium]
MTWFSPGFNRFFKDLAANNNREWFQANKKRYVQDVKEPFEAFVEAIIKEVAKHDKRVNITPKEAIFRIHRDIRFSKDKTPYKLNCSALVSAGGRKDMSTPGMYFELGPEHIRTYGGQYMPDKDALLRIRNKIVKDPGAFRKLYSQERFKELFGAIRGEKNKVLPKEFKTVAELEPLMYNKQFYFFSQLPASKVSDPDLVKLFMERYSVMRPLNDYLAIP